MNIDRTLREIRLNLTNPNERPGFTERLIRVDRATPTGKVVLRTEGIPFQEQYAVDSFEKPIQTTDGWRIIGYAETLHAKSARMALLDAAASDVRERETALLREKSILVELTVSEASS